MHEWRGLRGRGGLSKNSFCPCRMCKSFHLIPGKTGAGDGNRTRVASLEDWNSTIELHPQRFSSYRRLLPCQFASVYPSPCMSSLLLTGGRVIDPSQEFDGEAD